VQKALLAVCTAHTESPVRCFVPRKQGGGNQHRGFAFVECAGAAEAASLLAGLAQSTEQYRAEMVRKRRGGGGGGRKKPRGRKGRRRHQNTPAASGKARAGPEQAGEAAEGLDEDADEAELYESDFESEDESGDEVPASAAGGAAGGAGGGAADGAADGAAERSGGGEGEDACIEAMASFVCESREWALTVQGFLVDNCRAFDDTDENRLEWS